MDEFSRIQRLPAYVFNITGEMKTAARRRGEDIIDFGMGNPDGATPTHIVDKLVEAARKPPTHRYSVSRGLPRLRKAICNWYKKRYNVDLDPESEAIVTIGSKEGIAHLCLAILDSRDTVLVPNPSYPPPPPPPSISTARSSPAHTSSASPSTIKESFLVQLGRNHPAHDAAPSKALIVNFPSNPTTECARALPFLARLVALAREHGFWLIQDLVGYADIMLLTASSFRPAFSKSPAPKTSPSSSSRYQSHLQHARLARRLHESAISASGQRPRASQELLRLRHLHAHPGRVHRGIGRPSRNVSRRFAMQLPPPPRRPRRRPQQSWLRAVTKAEGHHVRLGADPQEPYRDLKVARVFQKLL